MNITHGKVYVQEREIGVDGKTNITEKLLDSVTFRNIDHVLYSTDGSISPFFEKYKGRPYSVQFRISQKDKHGIPIEFSGRLEMGYNLGLVPPMDWEGVEAGQRKLRHWMESVGFLSGNPETDTGSSMVYCMAPGHKIENMWTMLFHTDPIFVMDEYLDNGATCKATSFKSSRLYWTLMNELLDGKRNPEETEMLLKQHKFSHAYFKSFQIVKELRRVASLKTPELAQPLINSFKLFYNGAPIENCREWKAKEKEPNSVMYRRIEEDLRVTRNGCPATIEMILFDQNCLVPEELRESILFESIVKAWSQHMGLVNDIFSLKKEMEQGSTSNKVYLFHVHDGLSLEDAFQRACDEINMLNDLVQETGRFILQLYGEIPEVKQFVTVMIGVLFGGVLWHGVTTRYHRDTVFDCVIGLQ